ncbi:C4L/C10L-like gene family protein [Finch poxvirus]|uniref:C4L/C10L-like family protein n=1 Tax=Condorpox virus TaxID=3049970 RepID=A0AAT9UPR2_9POXV|nr:C4L/C10L-like gene family protein [Finch poxvirus]UOX38901.1 C4L/C10L-like gene family protein [Finch poxvirus]
MGLTCIDEKGSVIVHIFSESLLDDFKLAMLKDLNKDLDEIKRLVKVSKVFDYSKGKEVVEKNKRQSKSVILKDKLRKETISLLKDHIEKELKLFDNIIIKNDVTITVYEKGDFFSLHRDFVPLFMNNVKCMHLLLYLEVPDKGGETAIYLNENSKNVMKLKSDVIFDKSILHESIKIEEGTKCIALFDVLIDQNINKKNIVGKVNYLGTEIPLYSKESNDLSLCYCDFKVQRYSKHESYTAGVILDRSGRCVNVHIDGKITDNDGTYEIYSSFEVFCYLMSMDLDEIQINKGKNIAWSSLDNDDHFLPKDTNLYKQLIPIASDEHCTRVEMVGHCNDNNEYISCSVSRYYFNLPNK